MACWKVDPAFFQAKGHDSISECAPWGCECCLITVFFLNLDLVISRKTVHEGKGLMSGARINDLIDEGCGEVVFGTCPIEVAKVYASTNGTLFLLTRTRLETQVVYAMG